MIRIETMERKKKPLLENLIVNLICFQIKKTLIIISRCPLINYLWVLGTKRFSMMTVYQVCHCLHFTIHFRNIWNLVRKMKTALWLLHRLPRPAVVLTSIRLLSDLTSVKPFVNKEEFMNTEKLVKEFENGVGKSLHEVLLARAQSMQNWVSGILSERKKSKSSKRTITSLYLF